MFTSPARVPAAVMRQARAEAAASGVVGVTDPTAGLIVASVHEPGTPTWPELAISENLANLARATWPAASLPEPVAPPAALRVAALVGCPHGPTAAGAHALPAA